MSNPESPASSPPAQTPPAPGPSPRAYALR
jgi:hypothetical protein